MRIIPSVTLRDDQLKKSYPPGVEANVSDDIANDAIERGLAVQAVGDAAPPDTTDGSSAADEDDDPGEAA